MTMHGGKVKRVETLLRFCHQKCLGHLLEQQFHDSLVTVLGGQVQRVLANVLVWIFGQFLCDQF
jgi:hypothetical protein